MGVGSEGDLPRSISLKGSSLTLLDLILKVSKHSLSTVADNLGAMTTGTATMFVVNGIAPPVANADVILLFEDSSVEFDPQILLANDF